MYPGGRKFAVCLTHDVDTLSFPVGAVVRETVETLLQGQTTKSLKTASSNALKMFLSGANEKLNPSSNFAQIMDLESKYGAKFTFFFLLSDHIFDIEGCKIGKLRKKLKSIADAGWGIGLHGGHNTGPETKQKVNRGERCPSWR